MFFRSLLFTTLLTASALSSSAALASSAKEVQPLGVGASVPAAQVKTIDNTAVSLASLVADKPTLLVFYRGSWCPYCNTHLAALAEIEPKLLQLGFQIIAVTPDSLAGLKTMTEKNHLNYRLFSDEAMEAASAFGVAFRMDEKTMKAYAAHGVTLATVPGEPDARWLPVPAVFVISRSGVIKFVHTNPDYKARLSPEDVIAAAQAAL